MKAAALVVLFAGCLLLGRIKALRCGERARLLARLCAFLRFVRDGIAYACLPPADLISRAKDREDLKDAAFLQGLSASAAADGFASVWRAALAPLPLKEEERSLLLTWGEGLGKSDRESQLLSCDAALARLSALSNEAADETAKQSRMWMSLGTLGGALAVVMLI